MQRSLYRLPGLAILLAALPASAMMVAPAPIPQRVAQTDVIVVGKVTAIEDKTVEATPAPNVKAKTEYHIALIKIQDHILGAKGLTHIKVGYIVPKEVTPANPPAGGGPVLIRPIRRYPQVKFELDQEACLFLKKHHDGDFYITQMYFDVIDKKNPAFEKDVELAKKTAKLLEDPMASLKAKDADQRLLTASLLVAHYRAYVPNGKSEPISAEESKSILTALAEADWTKPITRERIAPLATFSQLGLTDKDGWTFKFQPNQPPTAYQDAAKAWVKEHAGTYRIQKLVYDTKDTKDEKK